MSFASVLLFPLAFLAPASLALQPASMNEKAPLVHEAGLWPAADDAAWIEAQESPLHPIPDEPETAWQVRIEQRMTIRIAPRGRARTPPDMLVAMPERARRYEERAMGHCLPARAIAGVQPERGNRLLLFLRDRRIVSAQLERSCRSMDFYSGFYLAGSRDGKLCVNRDKLQSRSGVKCGLTSMHQLVEIP